MVSKDSSMKVHGTTTDPPLHDDGDDDRMLMAEYAIGYDGLRYTYNSYRYDRLADAIAYSKLMRPQPSILDPGGPCVRYRTDRA
jgi:hypothetical protein